MKKYTKEEALSASNGLRKCTACRNCENKSSLANKVELQEELENA